MRGENRTKEEEELFSCFIRIQEKKVKLKLLRQERANKKKNAVPLVKKNFNMDKKFNAKELKTQVANASSATDRAKMMLKQGKLKLDQQKNTGFKKRKSSTGNHKPRPIKDDVPEFELPQYADDGPKTTDLYSNIPDSNIGLPKAKPKAPSTQQRLPRAFSQRQQIRYDEDPF